MGSASRSSGILVLIVVLGCGRVDFTRIERDGGRGSDAAVEPRADGGGHPSDATADASPTDAAEPVDSGCAIPPEGPADAEVLFVRAEDVPILESDVAIRDRLVALLGMDVRTMTTCDAGPSDASGRALVIVSESVLHAMVEGRFRTIPEPVLMMEPLLFDNMGMARDAPTDIGNAPGRSVEIVLPAHPLAAGLSGVVDVYAPAATNRLGWGLPSGDGVCVATLVGSARCAVLGFESGSMLLGGLAAPARRSGLFLFAVDGEATRATADGWALFDAAVLWTMGGA